MATKSEQKFIKSTKEGDGDDDRMTAEKTHSRGGSKHVLQVQGSKQKTIVAPLNDDSEEKRKRLAERSARQEHERNLIAAAASPRKAAVAATAAGVVISAPRSSPSSGRVSAVENVGNVRKIPLLANFEEWMKMATDNVTS